MESTQTARIDELKRNLLRYTDELYAENHSMFEMHMRNMATEKLATAAYGPVMLLTLGKVYCLQAKRFRGNYSAYFKCVLMSPSSHFCSLCTAPRACECAPKNARQAYTRVSKLNVVLCAHFCKVQQRVCGCRQQKDKIGGTFQMVNSAVKVMQHAQQFEKQDPEGSDAGAQAEQLRLMLDAMWAGNALDIQTTVSRACHQVRCAVAACT